jgi:hypothetical protein
MGSEREKEENAKKGNNELNNLFIFITFIVIRLNGKKLSMNKN